MDQTENNSDLTISRRQGLLAISPIAVFLLLYLVVSLIIGDFYKMPISVALLIASAWAVIILRGKPLARRVEIFSHDAGSSNVMYMVWIFILAGAFAALAKETGAIETTVNLALRWLPAEMLIPGLFLAACFISLSIGTSVGTVVALTPLAVELAQAENGTVPFFVAVVLGGAFFGDNLSFISDTTIAATRTQGCKMNDKFKANLYIVLPAALCALGLYIMLGADVPQSVVSDVENPWLVLPYLVIIIMAVAGINVTVVLAVGIVTALLLALGSGFTLLDMFGYMGEGVDSVGNLVIITLLAAGMLGLIKAAGGINYILQVMTRRINGSRGAMTSIALLVSIVNMCTANNTVAIITVGSLCKSIATRFGLDPRKTASILDTCSCIVQSLIPYGAQTLLATSLADISPAAPWTYMYYSWMLAGMVVLSIVFKFPRRLHQ
ncbi:MAG TPA: Na+/H+ antiporter NhaC family protein [Muribaculum sp.]|jgi:Na+/H+ antiporter NhaC|uniref:Na+/H+ antiporter NhaC family protein n=1 Tax=Heminiphilus faecis TaxID=2601703 RepID=A0ABV4CXY3_9BACT|nr:Na+/H+ antiporter NhaC family protein [Heminiphilus faecis]RLT77727.1 Na+/H+ antiporter NhaC family protein [bacterium J10(2018)]HRF69139.1 Na+/H+ antiporter NhaC family protein [Muribaculum sp.]